MAPAVTFDSLHIKEVIVPKLTEGTGTVRCRHGVMPVPVPATVNIVSAYKIPMELTGAKGEYVTPTGAAIAAAISSCRHLLLSRRQALARENEHTRIEAVFSGHSLSRGRRMKAVIKL